MYWKEYSEKKKKRQRKKLYRENNEDKIKEAKQEYMKKCLYHCPLCNYQVKLKNKNTTWKLNNSSE